MLFFLMAQLHSSSVIIILATLLLLVHSQSKASKLRHLAYASP